MEKTHQDIQYAGNQRIIQRMQEEICSAFGPDAWKQATHGCPLSGDMDHASLNRATQQLLERLDGLTANSAQVEVALSNVKHALTHADFAWARKKFLQYNHIDQFAEALLQDAMRALEQCAERGEPFYDQPISEEALAYARGIDDLFYGKRRGNTITATAIPYQVEQYLQGKDARAKRYYACHCAFARESILMEKTVSKTLCYCSLGHTKALWEAALDMQLSGRVQRSALGGDLSCRFVIDLPECVMQKYVW